MSRPIPGLNERMKTRIEHELDTRSVAFGVWLYRRTAGRIVRLWHRRAIVLTTTGRRSGRPRTVLVQVFADGSDLFVVAANSGLARRPGWYFNLLAEPRVVGELDGQRLQLLAEPLSDAQAADPWHQSVLGVAPDYEKYARRLGKVPPIFRLVPAPGDTAEAHELGRVAGPHLVGRGPWGHFCRTWRTRHERP